ncbi:MAG: hypothetical protein EKK37_08030 [Sphingobacteriales bacterium]|nr:MAG: hypothetical protein EKK37_08030 [Sphingobacteriales bacterium]
MELDNLKEIWNEVGSNPVQSNNNEQIAEMLNKSSQSPIAKMKRNLRWELITVILLFAPIAIFYFFAFEGKFSVIAWMYIGLLIFFAAYFYYKNKLLSEMQCAACMVKSNLELQVKTLEKLVHFYLIAGTLMVPLLMIWLWLILYNRLPSVQNSFHFWPSSEVSFLKTGLAWTVILLFFSIIFYYINKWYIHKLYGRHIAKLKSILNEMEQE